MILLKKKSNLEMYFLPVSPFFYCVSLKPEPDESEREKEVKRALLSVIIINDC